MVENKVILTIDKKDYAPRAKVFHRIAVRGVIRQEGKYAMICSEKYGEYKFPGGGRKEGEQLEDTLLREVKEETGLIVKPQTIKYVGRVEERRGGEHGDIVEQISHYYICEVEKERAERSLDEYEKEYGYTLKFVSLEEAIRNNERLFGTKGIPWVERDTAVMKWLSAK